MASKGNEKTPVDQFIARITAEYDTLSKQLKIIAKYVEQHRDHIGIEGIQQLAANCQVQPSAVVRFAKHFGFSGFSEMQLVFREGLTRQLAPSRNYRARIRDIIDSGAGSLSSVEIAREFLAGSQAAMHELEANLDEATFKKAVDMLRKTDCIWIAASRRSFPIAVYLDYALQHTDKRVCLMSALGNMHLGQMRSVRTGDVILAISFAPYAEETLAAVALAQERGARVIAITDSRMSPLAKDAEAVLIVQDNSTFGFRALTSTMGLAQSLFISLAYALELPYRPTSTPAQA
ncbi:MAG: RpiR family transcriptional regulator [Curvibacter sp. RIFCSPHIGHO2_12_FULL_63_18]|uniref:MurR/RpiR family transcriptional regulator n=1 Tax=Rhodoferax sp. TaxID=50421 RepID=UPI0008C89382|nr:MurR/RpiR family transcriptional regulator [Rhodoferax sp.]OGO99531.1 MAG: RpiR family transcriptional regulator [Curvibacter sp. GWA2_63_95]OGP04580.1 MAG: RpiR family transcriptional regulator [Curvibacter sp. RIFCSPHIGHO2_12_FULL_63_18]HCX80935.1 RpiR family transcriptional regulator [Rhodoferax sp.]